jgi:multicomponent Na+:H+ antiporter subunit F
MIILGAKIGIYILIGAFILVLIRLIKGPTIPDRVIALDLLAFISLGIILMIMVMTGKTQYLDVIIVLSLVLFIASVAIAKYLTKGG